MKPWVLTQEGRCQRRTRTRQARDEMKLLGLLRHVTHPFFTVASSIKPRPESRLDRRAQSALLRSCEAIIKAPDFTLRRQLKTEIYQIIRQSIHHQPSSTERRIWKLTHQPSARDNWLSRPKHESSHRQRPPVVLHRKSSRRRRIAHRV